MTGRVLCFGSLNIDHVYRVASLPISGATVAATGYEIHPGGKGLNQAVAAARAGAQVSLAGQIGPEGRWLLELAQKEGIDTTGVTTAERPTGHAIINVADTGENTIVVYAGANGIIGSEAVDRALSSLESGDIVVLQNETNLVPDVIRAASERGFVVVFNPSPMPEKIEAYPLGLVDYLVLNEFEAHLLTERPDPIEALDVLAELLPRVSVVLTLGEKGCYVVREGKAAHFPAYQVEVVDPTAAGDTFLGYLAAGLSRGAPIDRVIPEASAAAALAVTKAGATPSIPTWNAVEQFSKTATRRE